MKLLHTLLLIGFISMTIIAHGQKLDINGALFLGVEITLGNQNRSIQAFIKGIGTLSYGDATAEAGVSIYLNQLYKRHKINTKGVGGGYEVFALAGVGDNSNLLGASIFENSSSLIFNSRGAGGFKGLGFGFQRELLTRQLEEYSPRRGSLLLRFSENDHSLQVAFRNDFRFGKLFNGQATDYGATGSLLISYSRITAINKAYLAGIGIALFTPKADYSRTPKNQLNSDDGRKNVWYVKTPYEKVFYTNLYAYGAYQDQGFSLAGSLGVNSQKLGAYIQNRIHDSFGLNPRYPWDVTAKDLLFYELKASGNAQID